jgi:DNA-binding NarL/FixJ family response regulator
MSIRVAIADDHPIVSNGLKNILKDFSHIRVIAVYPTGKALLEGIRGEQPDVLLLDMHLPDLEGPALARDILKHYPQVRILVLSSSDIIVQVKKMLQLGAMGYLLKDSDDLTIVKAIETVYAGGQFLSPSLQQRLVGDLFRNKQSDKYQASLTRREKEILQLITREMTNQEIADQLFISLHTVDNHRSSLLQKLQVKNTAGLVRKAIENGLIDP